MGKRGPRGKLPEQDRLEGNPGKRKKKPQGVTAEGEPFIPDHLDEDAKQCVEMIRQSMPPAVYATVDSFLLSAFAQAWALHKAAVQALQKEKKVVPGSTGNLQPSPWVKIQNEQARIMMSAGDRLGLDPKARAALNVPNTTAAPKPESKFEGLISIPGGRSA